MNRTASARCFCTTDMWWWGQATARLRRRRRTTTTTATTSQSTITSTGETAPLTFTNKIQYKQNCSLANENIWTDASGSVCTWTTCWRNPKLVYVWTPGGVLYQPQVAAPSWGERLTNLWPTSPAVSATFSSRGKKKDSGSKKKRQQLSSLERKEDRKRRRKDRMIYYISTSILLYTTCWSI